jgi:hypothetical protein
MPEKGERPARARPNGRMRESRGPIAGGWGWGKGGVGAGLRQTHVAKRDPTETCKRMTAEALSIRAGP